MTYSISDPRYLKMFRTWLFMFAVALYAFTFGHSFNMDDELVSDGHRLVSKGISGIGKILSSPYYEDEMGYSYEYRPVTHISFALEHQFFGGTARSGHVLNALLYGLSCLVMFNLLRRMAPTMLLFPVVASLLFVIHPMHTEVVASIKNRDELLALLFAMLALSQAWLFNGSGAWWRLPAMVAMLLASLLSKGSALPFALVLVAGPALFSFHMKRSFALLAAVAVALALFVHLREWPLSRFLLPVGAMLAGLALVAIWRWAIRVDWRKVLRAALPRGWVAESTLNAGFSRFGILEAGLAMMAAGFMLFGHFTGKGLWSIVPMAAILLVPYWSGRHSIWNLMLLLALVLMSFISNDSEGSAHLLLAYMVVTLTNKEGGGRKVLLFATLLTAGCITAAGLVRDWPATMELWNSIDFPSESYLLIRFVSLWPVLPIALIYAYRDALDRKRLLKPMMGIMLVLEVMATVGASSVNAVATLCAMVLIFIAISDVTQRTRNVGTLAAALLLIACQGLTVMGVKMLVNPDPDAARVEQPMQQAPPATVQEPMADATASSTDDRPLTFVEFPLDVHAPLSDRLGTASVILGHYLKMMVIPWPQSFYYGYDEVPMADMRDPWAIISALLHLLLLFCALYFAWSHPMLTFGILTYLVSIFLFSNLVSPVAGMMGDRLTYVASFGFCIAAGYALTKLMERFQHPTGKLLVRIGLGVLLICFSGMTVARSLQWKDALTLMRHDILQVPRSSQAHNLLASHLMKNSFLPEYRQEQMDMRREALTHFKEAVRLWPEFFNVWYDMGRVYQMMNEPVNALQCYKEAHRLDSSFYNATINVGLIADQLGDHATAIEYYGRCIRFNPEISEPYGNLSYLYFRLGKFEESIAVNERAIAHNPSWPDPYTNIAKTYEAMGRPEMAATFRQRASNRGQ